MDISRINATTLGNVNLARADESDEVRSAREQKTTQSNGVTTDAVDLRGVRSESTEVTAARKAIQEIDTLDDARRAEILGRIQSGFYSSPEGIEQTADAMAKALTPKQGQ